MQALFGEKWKIRNLSIFGLWSYKLVGVNLLGGRKIPVVLTLNYPSARPQKVGKTIAIVETTTVGALEDPWGAP